MTHPTLPFLEHQVFAAGGHAVYLHQVLQHSSTLLGTAFLAWWGWAKLQEARIPAAAPTPVTLTAPLRAAIVTALLVPAAAAFGVTVLSAWPSAGADLPTIRNLLRASTTTALSVLGLAFVAYSVLWNLRGARRQAKNMCHSGAGPLH